MTLNYKVKTEAFEGPLELLLSLVEKRKLFINDISLAQVADDYIAYTDNLEELSIGDSANFILVASTLVLIKSKSLLPNLSLTEEEQENIDDLENRLKEYQQIKKLSENVKSSFGNKVVFFRIPNKKIDPIFSPSKDIDKESIFSAIKNVICSLPKKEIIPEKIIKKVISLEAIIENLTERIQASLKMSFKEFHGNSIHEDKKAKVSVIVSFLAMLELVKQGVIAVKQDKRFDDINMETLEPGTPRYY